MEEIRHSDTVFIYALSSPTAPETVRYVGQSQNPRARLRGHMGDARGGAKSHRANWLRQLIAAGLEPALQILEGAALDNWIERERFWIAHYRGLGARLVNQTDGGEGTLGFRWSEEERLRMSETRTGKKRPPETGARISAANRGKKMPLAVVEPRMGRFIVTAPDGSELRVVGLAPCCRLHGFQLGAVLEGRIHHSHGWRVRREGEAPKPLPAGMLKGLPYVVTGPAGEDYLVLNLTEWCAEHGVSRSALQQSLKRKAAYQGWQMIRAEWREGEWQVPANRPIFPEFKPDLTYSEERRTRLRERMRGEGNPFRGKHHTDEAKAKISARAAGRPSAKKGKPAPSSQVYYRKQYVCISPDGQAFLVIGLAQFCEERNLTRSNMVSVANGKWSRHKGWQCRRVEDLPEDLLRWVRECSIPSPPDIDQ